ncbi:hypothetical protein [Kribbella sp. NPDC023855]
MSDHAWSEPPGPPPPAAPVLRPYWAGPGFTLLDRCTTFPAPAGQVS